MAICPACVAFEEESGRLLWHSSLCCSEAAALLDPNAANTFCHNAIDSQVNWILLLAWVACSPVMQPASKALAGGALADVAVAQVKSVIASGLGRLHSADLVLVPP